jgi:cell division ATPase FtsA
MIDETVKSINCIVKQMSEKNELSTRALALSVECNQLYLEYLDGLLDNINDIDISVTVQVDGKTIKFQNADAMAAWMAEVMQ